MRTFSRFFIISATIGIFSYGWLFASAQTSGAGPLLEIPSGELYGTIPVRVITMAIVPGPIQLFLAPPQVFLGELVRSTVDPHRWEYQWDTLGTPDGMYQLTAQVQSAAQISRSVIIHNTAQSESGSVIETNMPPPPPPQPPPPAGGLPPPTPTSRPIVVELSQSGVAHDILYISLAVESVDGVEIFMGKLSDAEGRPIGRAERAPTNPNLWRFRLDTRLYDNGLYGIAAKIQLGSGFFWGKIVEITILNTTPPPPPPATLAPPPSLLPPPPPPPKFIAPLDNSKKEEQTIQPLTETEKDAIKRRIRDDVSVLTKTIEAIDNRPQETLELPDSDGDGITDYDEKNIYQTNPNTKDTDKDGINDALEILSSNDPNNAIANSISYESPKNTGTPRPEILAIADIVPVLTAAKTIDAITLTGQGPPHSLVTLYIFSTPFVVTVKTNAEGAWTYTFDKELADGKHEVYATITNSKGSVLAKSDPVPFIKTANAITKTPAIAQTTRVKPSIYGKHPTSFIVALVAATIGIAFVVIGLVVRRRRAEQVLPPQ